MSLELVFIEPSPPELAQLVAQIPAATPTIDLVEMCLVGLAEQSRGGYRYDLAAFARHCRVESAQVALEQLLGLDHGRVNALLAHWVESMSTEAKSPATIRRRIAALARFFKVARRFGLTSILPEVELPTAQAYRDTAGPGTRAWEKMLETAEKAAVGNGPVEVRDLAILLLLHDRALRRGEVVSADLPEDFDPSKPALQVKRKGKLSKVWLTISTRSALAVSRWVGIRGDTPGPLFLRCDPGRKTPQRLSGQAVNELVGRIARRAKVARPVRAHGLRHQSITEALDKGWDVRDVKELSGHAKIDTVLIYDDRRMDLGGQISRDLAGEARGRKPRRKGPEN